MKSDAKKPLIIVGNFGSPEYKQRILQMLKIRSKDKKIVFTGGGTRLRILEHVKTKLFCISTLTFCWRNKSLISRGNVNEKPTRCTR